MPDRGRHPPDLAVPAFDEFEDDPPVGDGLPESDGRVAGGDDRLGIGQPGTAREGPVALNHDTSRKRFELFGAGDSLDLNPIPSGMSLSGFEESGGPAGFVAQEQKPLGIRVEPPDRVDPWRRTAGRQGAVARSVRSELG